MMSKKKWVVLLFIFIIYLLLGASFFYKIESQEEEEKRDQEELERREIIKKLKILLNESDLNDILPELSEYCGKPVDKEDESPLIWDYYHSVFFAFTVVTTIGYGNLAPTTPFSRIFMILYGLIGIPINGILFATLGDYFGRTFVRVYKKWKNSKVKDYAASMGLVGQITLYLIPGLIVFLFLPAIVIMHFEKWDYTLSVYYAFVTLTTIGFGDYVAGVSNQGFSGLYFTIYQIFLLIWIIFGLGYLVMVLGFITRGLRSKKMVRLEKQLSHNIKATQSKIWHGFVKDFTYLRRIMNELYMNKFKPVYRDDITCSTPPKIGSQSFPDLRKLIAGEASPTHARRRAFSECVSSRPLTRVQSDSDLSRIDKEATFAALTVVQPCELLVNVATALTKTPFEEPFSDSEDEGGVQGFSDNEILASEVYGSAWTLGSQDLPAQPPHVHRHRAASEVKIPSRFRQDSIVNDWTWSGPAATQKIQELRQQTKFNRTRKRTRDNTNTTTKTFFDKIKSSLSRSRDDEKKQIDVEKQLPPWENTVHSGKSMFSIEQEHYLTRTGAGRASVFSVPETRVLEETSVADLLRALTSIHSRVAGASEALTAEPRRKLGTASLTPPKVPSMLELFNAPPQMNTRAQSIRSMPRRASATPALSNPMTRRRFSLHPVSEDQLMMPPPPYSPTTSLPLPQVNQSRRTSLFQTALTASAATQQTPVHKQVSRLRGPANARILYTRTRHNSLKDLRIERP